MTCFLSHADSLALARSPARDPRPREEGQPRLVHSTVSGLTTHTSVAQFATKYAPLYERRSAIITGQVEPTEAEIEAGRNADSDDEDEDDEAQITEIDDEATGATGIPEFWLTALKNNPDVADLITDRDEEVRPSSAHVARSRTFPC